MEFNEAIIGGRVACGKTHELIKKSSREWLYIVCANRDHAESIYRRAKSMDLDIPYPITFAELPINPGARIKGVLVDELEQLLSYFIQCPIFAASTSFKILEFESLNKENRVLKELLEGNDGMSVKEIQGQFIDQHRNYLKLKEENERLYNTQQLLMKTLDSAKFVTLKDQSNGDGLREIYFIIRNALAEL